MRKSFARLAITLFTATLAGHSYATDGIYCTGTIKTLGLHSTNRVILRLSSMNTTVQICDLGKTVGTAFAVTAEQCKAAYSTLLTAYTLKQDTNIYFDNVVTGTSCTNFASWELATARWVHLDN